jgi:AraC-like DNA-binding protein
VLMNDRANREPRVLCVLGALLGDSAEEALLRQAIQPPIALRKVENRFRVLDALRENSPDVVVFAMQDRNHLPTAPLISECARARPGIRIVLLCAAPPPRGAVVLAAARAGARVLVAPTSNELASILERIARSLSLGLALDCSSLTAVQPPMLRQLLCAAAKTIAEDGRVDTMAQHLQVSARTLSRYSHRQSLSPPRAILSATRLLWACALMESMRRDLGAVSRATGFSGSHALRSARERYLSSTSPFSSATPLPTYREALLRVVNVLGGHVME